MHTLGTCVGQTATSGVRPHHPPVYTGLGTLTLLLLSSRLAAGAGVTDSGCHAVSLGGRDSDTALPSSLYRALPVHHLPSPCVSFLGWEHIHFTFSYHTLEIHSTERILEIHVVFLNPLA